MFSLIAQYIGYGAENEVNNELGAVHNCSFGETEEGDWTLVEVANEKADGVGFQKDEEEFHRIPSPAPSMSLHSSFTENVDIPAAPAALPVSAVSQVSGRRMRCAKSNRKRHMHQSRHTQHRPNQMKRSNQVFCNRGIKVYQKMRQIVHQPRKF